MALSRNRLIIFRVALLAALIVITHLATTALQYPVVSAGSDKLNHIFAFYVLALLIDFSFPEGGFGAFKISALLAYGLALEGLQLFLPYRSAAWWDVFADAMGLLAYALSQPIVRRTPWLRDRWDMVNSKS